MALGLLEQIKTLLQDKKRILVTFRKSFDGDALGSAVALALVLEKLGKQVDIVSDGFVLHDKYTFLKKAKQVRPQIGDLHQFIITLDVEKTGVSELSYDVKDKKLRIFVTPEHGYITPEALSTRQTEFKYDTIFVLDTPDLKSLENIYTTHEEFFYAVPIINIDHKSSNEQFGTINVVTQQASSTAESMYELLMHLADEHLERDVAQALLTGIIAGTNGFRHKKVRPQTLHTAGKLVDLGADRRYIMQRLFQTKSIGTFRLWGSALSHLQYDIDHKLVWTTLTRDDFTRAGATPHDIQTIIDELITTSPEAQYILVLYEEPTPQAPHSIHGILKILPAEHATNMMKQYNAIGDETNTSFTISGRHLHEVEHELIGHIKKNIQSI